MWHGDNATRIPNHRNICSKFFCNFRDSGDERAGDEDCESREPKKNRVIAVAVSAISARSNER